MKMKSSLAAAMSLGLLLGASSMSAQPQPSQAEANKKLVLDYCRVVLQAHNAEAAKDYQSEDYVQHNPFVPNGRDAFIKTFKAIWKEPLALKAELENPPVAVVAQGDL